MSRVKSKNTRPEWIVRRLIFGLGYRYTLHDDRLPGSPDIVFRKKKKVIFVHGCFWHQHTGCSKSKLPASNVEFWQAKLAQNVQRDEQAINLLKKLGWDVQVIWECEIKNIAEVTQRIVKFLG